jgi:hypothetical protein
MKSMKYFLCVMMLVALAVTGFAERKTTSGGDVVAKDVLSGGGGLGTNSASGALQSSIGQDAVGRSGNLDLGILIGGYINAWRPLGGGQLVEEYTFDTGQGWTAATNTGYSLPTPYGPTGGKIGLEGKTTGFQFGFWQTDATAIAYEADKIFRARYFLSRNTGMAADAMPTIRLRWNAANFSGTGSVSLSSTASGSNVPPESPATKEYRSYLYPACDTGGLGLTFDMLDFDPSGESGLVLLDRVVVETIDHGALSGQAAEKTYDANFGAWEFNVNFGGAYGAVSSSGSGADRISLGSTVAGMQAGFAQSPGNEMAYTADRLYRATFNVSRTGANAMATPWVRLRAFSEDNQVSASGDILHGGTPGPGAAPQTPTTKGFEVYWETPTLPGSPGTDEDGFRVAFDLLDFDNLIEGDTMLLESVVIESFTIPPASGP